MPEFQQIKTEYAYGVYKGTMYGSQIRVVMRSDTHVMYVGYGLSIATRADDSSNSIRRIASDSKKATLQTERVREYIVKTFGEGSDEMAIKAISTRGMGTILVDGGGVQLPLPHAEQARKHAADYGSITPTATVEMTGLKTCMQCGEQLSIHRTQHHLDIIPEEGHPTTIEDCQKLSNQPVVSVHGFGSNKPREWWKYISWFYTWDGESYLDEHFCARQSTDVERQQKPHLRLLCAQYLLD
jgi:hypothetical protein